jgi:hypothetical protein
VAGGVAVVRVRVGEPDRRVVGRAPCSTGRDRFSMVVPRGRTTNRLAGLSTSIAISSVCAPVLMEKTVVLNCVKRNEYPARPPLMCMVVPYTLVRYSPARS